MVAKVIMHTHKDKATLYSVYSNAHNHCTDKVSVQKFSNNCSNRHDTKFISHLSIYCVALRLQQTNPNINSTVSYVVYMVLLLSMVHTSTPTHPHTHTSLIRAPIPFQITQFALFLLCHFFQSIRYGVYTVSILQAQV